jgi:hypothetical protein
MVYNGIVPLFSFIRLKLGIAILVFLKIGGSVMIQFQKRNEHPNQPISSTSKLFHFLLPRTTFDQRVSQKVTTSRPFWIKPVKQDAGVN